MDRRIGASNRRMDYKVDVKGEVPTEQSRRSVDGSVRHEDTTVVLLVLLEERGVPGLQYAASTRL
jgi:hypothetical protein